MTARHHLDPSTLVSYSAGALPVELAVVAATHLESCGHCRRQLAQADRIGGALVEQQQPDPVEERREDLRRSMLDRISGDTPDDGILVAHREATPPVNSRDPDRIPTPLQAYFGASYRALKWRWVAPGVQVIRAANTKTLMLLKIGPGRSMPVHSHGRSELTQVLQGAYNDHMGHFAPGDMADLDSDVEHQPVTVPGVPCICVSALDAPLRFQGWIARKLQPLFGF